MTYKLPEPDFVRLSDLQSGLDKSWSASSMQAAYGAGRRDMLERAIAVFSSAGPKDTFTANLIRVALKELLK